jgi:hypothetical protein
VKDRDERIGKLIEEYRRNAKNRQAELMIFESLRKLTDAQFGEVEKYLYENFEGFSLKVADVRKAIALRAPEAYAWHTPVVEVECPLCGLDFRFKCDAMPGDNAAALFNRCPRCGLDGQDIMRARRRLAEEGLMPEGWDALLEKQMREWEARRNHFHPDGWAPWYDKAFLKWADEQDEIRQKTQKEALLKAQLESVLAVQARLKEKLLVSGGMPAERQGAGREGV